MRSARARELYSFLVYRVFEIVTGGIPLLINFVNDFNNKKMRCYERPRLLGIHKTRYYLFIPFALTHP